MLKGIVLSNKIREVAMIMDDMPLILAQKYFYKKMLMKFIALIDLSQIKVEIVARKSLVEAQKVDHRLL